MNQDLILPKNDLIKSTLKHDGGNTQVWGCFSNNGVGDLYKIKNNLEKKQYHLILQRHTIPPGLKLCGKGFVLLQDNDPKNASYLCKNYLKRKEEKGDLKIMAFSPQSPDHNPIGNVWDNLKREKVKHNPTSKDNLWDVLSQCWNSLKPAVRQKLVHSMPNGVKAVLKTKGGHTKY